MAGKAFSQWFISINHFSGCKHIIIFKSHFFGLPNKAKLNSIFKLFSQFCAFCPSLVAFKETAFLLAVSSAALTHALAKACSSGRMERCTCDESPGIQHREAWQWGACGDNLKYSTKFLKKFLGQKKVSKDLRAQVDAQNINVGIRVSANTRIRMKAVCSALLLR